MDTQPNSPLTHTWKAQIHQLAARNPRLAQELWQNRQVYFDRFVHFYWQLANLPRKFRRKFLKRLATTLAGAALFLALGQALPARAAVITVDGVVCTLAEAIDSANNDNAAGNGCVDGNGADVIDLQTDVTLAAALPLITSEITLEGNGHTIDGNDSFLVLNVQITGNLTLNDSTITGGHTDYYSTYNGGGIANYGALTVNNSTLSGNSALSGGGIFNQGTVEVNNSTLTGNSATGNDGGGIFNQGTVEVNDSTFSGNSAFPGGGGIFNENGGIVLINNSTLSGNSGFISGGGIYNYGTLIVNDSILSGNSATWYFGGGISNFGTVTVNNSTLSGNSANYAGGIHNDGTVTVNNSILSGNSGGNSGGGILNYDTLTVNDSTLSENSANKGAGIFNGFGTLVVNNSTFSGNLAVFQGGGIFNGSFGSPLITLNRSLISGNAAGNGAEIFKNLGVITANNYNVIGYGGDPRSVGFTPGAFDIIPPGGLDTILDIVLADNGGPTFTHALVSGSVAIDVAPNADCLVPPINGLDQRGYARNVDGDGNPSGNECDAGAFEFASPGFPTSTPTATNVFRPTKTPVPTSTPLTRTPPPVTPTRTPTPRVTQSVTRTPTQLANLDEPDSDQTPSNAVVQWFVASLLLFGQFVFFRKNRG